jgi:hypothetical protein
MPGRLVFSTTADGAASPTERMRIDNLGLVTISSTISGVTANFVSGVFTTRVSGNAITGNTAGFTAVTGTTGVFGLGSGRLLVNTSSARSNFFNTTITSNIVQIEGAGLNASAGATITTYNLGGGSPFLAFARSNNAIAGTNALVTSGQSCGVISFQGNDGTEFVEAASISGLVDGTAAANNMPGCLVFAVTPSGSSSASEAMRIINSGGVPRVGINTAGTSTFSGNLYVGGLATTVIKFVSTLNGAAGSLTASPTTIGLAADTNLPLTFSTNGTERVRITSSGRFQVTGPYDNNITAVAALNMDLSTSNFFTKTINGDSTFTVSNTPASRAFAFTLELTHTSGTITWFSGVEWPGGTAPTLTIGKTHLFMFITDDGGTRWRGSSLINYTN